MKNHAITGIVMLALGVSIGWMAKSSTVTDEIAKTGGASKMARVSAPNVESSPSPAESRNKGKREIRPAEEDSIVPDGPTPEQMEQAKNIQSQMSKRMADQQREKFQKQIDRLTENLSLTDAQKAKLTAWLDEKMESLEDLDFTDPESAIGMTELSKLLNEDDLQAQLAGTLTPEQEAALGEYRTRERASKVDALALKSLSKLQSIIQFEDGQREKVYALLAESAEETLDDQVKNPDISSMLTEGMGIEMDPYGLNIQQAMTEAAGNYSSSHENDDEDEKSMVQRMRKIVDERIEAKVEKLRPALNEKQLENYRNELQTKGLGIYATVFDSMEENEGDR